jgi:hypothetical protein
MSSCEVVLDPLAREGRRGSELLSSTRIPSVQSRTYDSLQTPGTLQQVYQAVPFENPMKLEGTQRAGNQ